MVTKEETAVIVSPKGNLPQSLSPDSTIHASSTDREGNASILPEKPSEDGYNWRKYGQKNVKGNEFIRSYYKCSHPNCLVKKQVERSHDGRITDITYLGNHDHVKPHTDPRVTVPSLLSVKVQVPECPPSVIVEGKPSDLQSPVSDRVQKMEVCENAIVETSDHTPPACITPVSQARDDLNENFTLKRRKKSIEGPDSATEKPNHESRVVVHTVSEVDIVNDGYRWRKYGQKMVKGNPNPRSYYRCSTTGCPVKKHVERASNDPKVVITTYEGQHDHSVPPVRTIVPQAAAAYAGGTESNGLSNSKPEERDAAQDSAIVLFKPEIAVAQHNPEKDDSVDPTTKKEKNIATVVKTEDVKTESTAQEANHTAERIDRIPQTTKEIDIGIQAKSNLEMTNQQKKPGTKNVPQTTMETDMEIQAEAKLEMTSQQQNPGSENVPQTTMETDTGIQAEAKLVEMTSQQQNPGSKNILQTTMEISSGIQAEAKLKMTSQGKNPGSKDIDQTAKQENLVSPQVDTKPEVVSTDVKRAEAAVESSHAEAKPNGVQRPNPEAVNC